jgi:hypothetical protein
MTADDAHVLADAVDVDRHCLGWAASLWGGHNGRVVVCIAPGTGSSPSTAERFSRVVLSATPPTSTLCWKSVGHLSVARPADACLGEVLDAQAHLEALIPRPRRARWAAWATGLVVGFLDVMVLCISRAAQESEGLGRDAASAFKRAGVKCTHAGPSVGCWAGAATEVLVSSVRSCGTTACGSSSGVRRPARHRPAVVEEKASRCSRGNNHLAEGTAGDRQT